MAAALALGLGVAGPAGATPSALFGAGPRSVALAGGGASLALGPEAVVSNPGALASQHEKVLAFGLRASSFTLSLDDARGESRFAAEQSKGLTIGVATPLVRPSADGWRAALGVFAETPPDFLVRANLPLGDEITFPLSLGRAGALDLGVGLGVGFGPIAFGGGVEVLAALSGRTVVAGTGGSAAGVGDELLPAWGPAFGLTADLGDVGTLGVALRTVLRADFDVNVAAATIGGLIGIAPLNVQGIAHYEPLKVDAELSRPFGAWLLLAGARYERWSDFSGWVGRTVDCPPGFACGTSEAASPGYSDVVSPHVGLERSFEGERIGVTARAGYSWVPSAVPEQRDASNALDMDRHAFAAGYRVRVARRILPLDLEGALRFDFLAPRTHHKQGEAGASVLGPEVTTAGSIVTFSMDARFEL